MPFSDEDLKSFGSSKPQASGFSDADIAALGGHTPLDSDSLKNLVGQDWSLADTNSPLSAFERGAFGAVRYPDKQMKWLETKFGKGNVQVNKMDENSSNFLVKDETGIHQVDPHGLSDIPNDLMSGNYGQALNRIKGANLKNTIGGASQFVGEKGALSMAAAGGFAAGAPYGAIAGPVGALATGLTGAVVAGGAESLGEAGIRKALDYVQEKSGEEIPGAKSLSAEDLGHQVTADMLFSGQQELAAGFLNAGIKGSGKLLAKAVEGVADSPQAKTAVATLIKTFGGLKDGLARAWAEAPDAVASYIPQALKDSATHGSELLNAQKSKIQDFFDSTMSAKKAVGKQYDAIERQAGGNVFDASDELVSNEFRKTLKPNSVDAPTIKDTIDELQKRKYLDGDLNVIPKNPDAISRDTTGRNGSLLKDIAAGFRDLTKNNGKTSYSDLRQFKADLSNYIDGEGQASDGYLRQAAKTIQTSIKNSLSNGLHQIDPALAERYGKLNAKYGDLMDGTMLEDLASKSQDKRLDAFLKQLHRNDGSYNATLMNQISNVLGVDNPTRDILHMQAAIESTPWLKGRSIFKYAPASGKLTRTAMDIGRDTYDQAMTGANDMANAPAQVGSAIAGGTQDQQRESITAGLKKAHSVFKALPDEIRQSFIKSPAAVSTLGDLIKGSPMQEETGKSQLLQQAGAFQNSQFGR